MTVAMKLKKQNKTKQKTFSLERKLDKSKQCITKQKHHFASKNLSSQSYDFSSSMYRYESLIVKKAECQRIDAFKSREGSWESLGLQGDQTSQS